MSPFGVSNSGVSGFELNVEHIFQQKFFKNTNQGFFMGEVFVYAKVRGVFATIHHLPYSPHGVS
jgi:hypothetical protein